MAPERIQISPWTDRTADNARQWALNRAKLVWYNPIKAAWVFLVPAVSRNGG